MVPGLSDTERAHALGIEADDIVLPFQIDPLALRGRLVRLGPALDRILKRHAYPAPVAAALAELTALAAALAATLKYDGVFTVQIKGDGPVRLAVADVTAAGDLRAYAQFDADRVAGLGADKPSPPRLFGAGYLAFTVDQGADTERYQGIVELTGASLAECAHHYFRQSEQFQAALKVTAGAQAEADGTSAWRAAALMLQRLPPDDAAGSAEGRPAPAPAEREAEEDGWRRAVTLMGSATATEMLDPGLAPWRLVDRLFLAEGVRIYRPLALRHACRCSRDRVERVLRSLPPAELADLAADGRLVVTCEFCNSEHVFAPAELDLAPAR